MSGYTSLTQGFGATTQDVKRSLDTFGSSRYVSGTREFLESNSLVAKVAFLLLIVIVFIVLLRLGTSLLGYLLTPSRNPKLVDGLKAGNKPKVIPQDPRLKNSQPIYRSANQQDGIEFTYSVWLMIDDIKDNGQYKHIFHKGNDGFSMGRTPDGMNFPNNAPGLYLGKDPHDLNSLVVVMNTYDPNDSTSQTTIMEKVIVQDIPLNKWFHVAIRLEGKQLDTYVNGMIVNRTELRGVPKQNYGDVYVSVNGGFDGEMSNLFYNDYALSVNEINRMVSSGPNLKSDATAASVPRYLSLQWYFDQSN